MTKRDRLRVVYDILDTVMKHRNSIKSTPLLRQSNLSQKRFKEYINELLEKGFIKEIKDNGGKIYFTLTSKGFDYLSNYKTITNFIESFGL